MIRAFGLAALVALTPTLSVAQDLSDERAFAIATEREACGEGGIIADATFRDANTIVVDCAEVGAGFIAAGTAGAAAAFGGIGGAALAGLGAVVVVGALAGAGDGDSSNGTN